MQGRRFAVENSRRIRVLAVVVPELRQKLTDQLSCLGMIASVVSSAAELGERTRKGEVYDVALLPSALPAEEDWWPIWGELTTLPSRPAILVYARKVSFQLWSGVLEAGGYDVVVEPLTDNKLRSAIVRAAEISRGDAEECR